MRRVFLVLLAAFVVVWITLVAYDHYKFRQAIAIDQGLKKLGLGLTTALVQRQPAQRRFATPPRALSVRTR